MKKVWRYIRKVTLLLAIGMLCLGTGCGVKTDDTEIRVGGLKGPTTMGILFMQDAREEFSNNNYSFSMVTAADELVASVVRGDVDIALLPANVASVLHAKTEGKVSVIDINTLGVLYLVTGDSTLTNQQSLNLLQLKGRTIYLTGMGTTPDYAMKALMKEYQLSEEDIHLEYKSEATEIAALLLEDSTAIGLLPQPFVTSAMMQNEDLHIILNMDQEFLKVCGYNMVTGVTIVRTEFLEEHEICVKKFLDDHEKSIHMINADVEKGAELVVKAEILPKEPIAQKAIPFCNIHFVRGEEMKEKLSNYLTALYEVDPKAVGGALPSDSFYYTNK